MKRIFFLAIVLVSCSVDKKELYGDWQATQYFESGQTIDAALQEVQLSFLETGEYRFRSIGYYEEQGTFRVAGRYLFLKDSSAENGREKTFKILYCAPDSLKLGMQADSVSRVVFFGRIH